MVNTLSVAASILDRLQLLIEDEYERKRLQEIQRIIRTELGRVRAPEGGKFGVEPNSAGLHYSTLVPGFGRPTASSRRAARAIAGEIAIEAEEFVGGSSNQEAPPTLRSGFHRQLPGGVSRMSPAIATRRVIQAVRRTRDPSTLSPERSGAVFGSIYRKLSRSRDSAVETTKEER